MKKGVKILIPIILSSVVICIVLFMHRQKKTILPTRMSDIEKIVITNGNSGQITELKGEGIKNIYNEVSGAQIEATEKDDSTGWRYMLDFCTKKDVSRVEVLSETKWKSSTKYYQVQQEVGKKLLEDLASYTTGNPDRSSKDFWDMDNEVTFEENGVTYHAYLSKDKSESWIYEINLKNNKEGKLQFPSEINGIKTTVIGAVDELYEPEEKDWCSGIFGEDFEPWHEVDADYDERIKELIVPDSVEILTGSAMAGLRAVETVKLSDNLEEISAYTFQNDSKLKEVTIGKKMKEVSPLAFEKCDNLEQFNVAEDGELTVVNGMLVTKDKTDIVLAPRQLKEAKIPEGVSHIRESAFDQTEVREIWIPSSLQQSTDYAFLGANIEEWHLEEKCGLAKSNGCIYEKETGELVYIYSQKKVIVLPDEVTQIGGKFASVERDKLTIELPKTFKKFGELAFAPYIDCYFNSETPPVVDGEHQADGVPFVAYIPEKYREIYLDWLEKNYYFNRDEDTDEYFIEK